MATASISSPLPSTTTSRRGAASYTVFGAGTGGFPTATGTDTPVADINAVIPVNTAGNYDVVGSVTFNSTSHPVSDGVGNFSANSAYTIEIPFTATQVDSGAT